MSHEPAVAFPKIAYTREEAAQATGLSRTVIDQAIASGDLIANYHGAKPVIRAIELDRWIAALPTEPARGRWAS